MPRPRGVDRRLRLRLTEVSVYWPCVLADKVRSSTASAVRAWRTRRRAMTRGAGAHSRAHRFARPSHVVRTDATGTGGGRRRFRVHPRRTAAPSGGAARRASASDARRFADAAGNAGADAGHRSGCPRLRRIQAEARRRPGRVRAGAGVRRGAGSTGGGGQRGRAGCARARRSAARTLRARAPVRHPDEPRAHALDRDSDARRGDGRHRRHAATRMPD